MAVEPKKTEAIKPVSEKIQGPLGEYFQVVSKDYKENESTISIEIKRIKDGFPEPWEKGMEVGFSEGKFEPHFTIELQDADGNVISKDKTEIVFDNDDLKSIAALGIDESSSITFGYMNFIGVTQFKVGSTFEVHPVKDKSGSSNSSSSSSSSSRSNSNYDYDDEDIDKALDAAQKSLELTKDAMDIYKSLGD